MRLFRLLKKKKKDSGRTRNRRPSPRIRPGESSPVEVQIMGSRSLDIMYARDISVAGVAVYLDHGLEGYDKNEEVEILITLPRERTFLAKGIIRHVSEPDKPDGYFGVEFTDLAERHLEKIRTYIEERDSGGF